MKILAWLLFLRRAWTQKRGEAWEQELAVWRKTRVQLILAKGRDQGKSGPILFG